MCARRARNRPVRPRLRGRPDPRPLRCRAWSCPIEQGIAEIPDPDLQNGIIPVPGNVTVITLPDAIERGRIWSWNSAHERELPGATLLVAPIGSTRYNALQTRFTRRMRNGFQFNVNCTYAHGMGMAGASNSDNQLRIQIPETSERQVRLGLRIGF